MTTRCDLAHRMLWKPIWMRLLACLSGCVLAGCAAMPAGDSGLTDSLGMVFVRVPAGEFLMGSDETVEAMAAAQLSGVNVQPLAHFGQPMPDNPCAILKRDKHSRRGHSRDAEQRFARGHRNRHHQADGRLARATVGTEQGCCRTWQVLAPNEFGRLRWRIKHTQHVHGHQHRAIIICAHILVQNHAILVGLPGGGVLVARLLRRLRRMYRPFFARASPRTAQRGQHLATGQASRNASGLKALLYHALVQ